ncbi:hypothetical protein Tco_0988509 [Tanacetum coccineum]|uniref:Uncharacterized protein n=1 Tax=Tanacetum coccineum TaxID=301880 RepID=A0ABQ5ER57_9ASTR
MTANRISQILIELAWMKYFDLRKRGGLWALHAFAVPYCDQYNRIFLVTEDHWNGSPVSAVLGPMTYLVAVRNLTGQVVIVIVILIVVVDDVSLILKLSFMIISFFQNHDLLSDPLTLGYVDGFLQSLRLRGRFPVGPVFLLGLLALAIDAACAFRAEEMPSLISVRVARIILQDKKYGDQIVVMVVVNTGDGVKIVGGVIGSSGEIGDELDESMEARKQLDGCLVVVLQHGGFSKREVHVLTFLTKKMGLIRWV